MEHQPKPTSCDFDVMQLKHYQRLQEAIDNGLFSIDMCELKKPPSLDEIEKEKNSRDISLSTDHINLLQEWGGSNLDEIRIDSLGHIQTENGFTNFANNYCGYIFTYNEDGEVFSLDTDGGKRTRLADSIPEFINEFFLGPEGRHFYGDEWIEELKSHGMA